MISADPAKPTCQIHARHGHPVISEECALSNCSIASSEVKKTRKKEVFLCRGGDLWISGDSNAVPLAIFQSKSCEASALPGELETRNLNHIHILYESKSVA